MRLYPGGCWKSRRKKGFGPALSPCIRELKAIFAKLDPPRPAPAPFSRRWIRVNSRIGVVVLRTATAWNSSPFAKCIVPS